MSLEFFLTSLIVVLLPGTGVLYTLAVGLGRGFRASLAAAAGCTIGIVPAALASVIGLAALLHTSALAFQIIKYLGVLYLFYMAWGIVKEDGAMEINTGKTATGYVNIAVTGTLINVLNPKLSLFFLAFLPQFVPSDVAHTGVELLKLALAFMAMTFVVFIGYGTCAALARDYVIRKPSVMAWIKRCFATAFGALGVKLALSE
ncbi:LysE family translocator [Ruegeria lacuscaerulensis]|uniref:LysE family translocator n=1 Tax=Ruegeria lacuscaerulensis TaxID=55218 RepID=UPI00147FEE67|nr:LysE family translocator [Ruegeria lacuscaerulensis]